MGRFLRPDSADAPIDGLLTLLVTRSLQHTVGAVAGPCGLDPPTRKVANSGGLLLLAVGHGLSQSASKTDSSGLISGGVEWVRTSGNNRCHELAAISEVIARMLTRARSWLDQSVAGALPVKRRRAQRSLNLRFTDLSMTPIRQPRFAWQ